jgi:nucleotide-binding universal stress UspA family protein
MTKAFERDIHHILVAVDGSDSSLRAVSYVGDLLNGMKECKVLLLHVVNEPEEDFFASTVEKDNWVAEKQKAGLDVLQQCKHLLVEKGLDPGRIFVRVSLRQCPSIAECILQEAESAQSKTIVVARKGVSRKEEFLFGSVSNHIIHHAKDCTVWVVE